MTDNTDDTTGAQPPDSVENGEHEAMSDELAPSYFVTDREDSGTLVVIAETGKKASEHMVAAAGETVAALNPSYPDDDPVLFCTYRNALDEHFGERWRSMPASYLSFQVGDHGVPVYSFPESRLVRVEDEFENGDENDSEDED